MKNELHKDERFLGCCAVYSDRSFPTFALMMKDASTPETSVNFYQTARRYIPEDNHRQVFLRSQMRCNFWQLTDKYDTDK
jgi:hypothetical protein